ETIEAKSGMQRSGQSGFERKVTEYGFKDIADVVAVEKLIRNTILRNKPAPADEDLEDAADVEQPIGGVAVQEARKKKVSPQDVEASRELIEDSPVSQRTRDRALERLDDDERVLWVGQPHLKLILLRSLMPAGFCLVAAVVLVIFALKQPSW